MPNARPKTVIAEQAAIMVRRLDELRGFTLLTCYCCFTTRLNVWLAYSLLPVRSTDDSVWLAVDCLMSLSIAASVWCDPAKMSGFRSVIVHLPGLHTNLN